MKRVKIVAGETSVGVVKYCAISMAFRNPHCKSRRKLRSNWIEIPSVGAVKVLRRKRSVQEPSWQVKKRVECRSKSKKPSVGVVKVLRHKRGVQESSWQVKKKVECGSRSKIPSMGVVKVLRRKHGVQSPHSKQRALIE